MFFYYYYLNPFHNRNMKGNSGTEAAKTRSCGTRNCWQALVWGSREYWNWSFQELLVHRKSRGVWDSHEMQPLQKLLGAEAYITWSWASWDSHKKRSWLDLIIQDKLLRVCSYDKELEDQAAPQEVLDWETWSTIAGTSGTIKVLACEYITLNYVISFHSKLTAKANM